MEIIPGAVVHQGERRREKRRAEQEKWEQLRYHTAQARRHRTVSALIIRMHEQEAQRLAKELGIDDYEDGGTAA